MIVLENEIKHRSQPIWNEFFFCFLSQSLKIEGQLKNKMWVRLIQKVKFQMPFIDCGMTLLFGQADTGVKVELSW